MRPKEERENAFEDARIDAEKKKYYD